MQISVLDYIPVSTWLVPWWLSGIEPACQAGEVGSTPGSGRSPGEGNGNSLQDSCLGDPMDRGAWRAIVHGVAKSRARLHDNIPHSHIQTPVTFSILILCVQTHTLYEFIPTLLISSQSPLSSGVGTWGRSPSREAAVAVGSGRGHTPPVQRPDGRGPATADFHSPLAADSGFAAQTR